ncbi:MAG: hypothetical protein ABIF92_00625 [archaeon]
MAGVKEEIKILLNAVKGKKFEIEGIPEILKQYCRKSLLGNTAKISTGAIMRGIRKSTTSQAIGIKNALDLLRTRGTGMKKPKKTSRKEGKKKDVGAEQKPTGSRKEISFTETSESLPFKEKDFLSRKLYQKYVIQVARSGEEKPNPKWLSKQGKQKYEYKYHIDLKERKRKKEIKELKRKSEKKRKEVPWYRR